MSKVNEMEVGWRFSRQDASRTGYQQNESNHQEVSTVAVDETLWSASVVT